jgi:dTDP-4-dehydrorhamnose reductase
MAKRILVTGATGQLGAYAVRELVGRGFEVVAWGHSRAAIVHGIPSHSVDLVDVLTVERAFFDAAPDVVIHCAAMAAVSDCARDPNRADAVNVSGTAGLTRLAESAGIRLVFVSTDLVFDGENAPYGEDAERSPLSVYGRTKALAEDAVCKRPRNAVIRVSLLFGPSGSDRKNYFDSQVAAIRGGAPLQLFHDEWRTPLDLATAAKALVAVADSSFSGLLHVGGPERMSRLELGERLAQFLGVRSDQIQAVSRSAACGEPRPRDTSLNSSNWRALFPAIRWPRLEEALKDIGVS